MRARGQQPCSAGPGEGTAPGRRLCTDPPGATPGARPGGPQVLLAATATLVGGCRAQLPGRGVPGSLGGHPRPAREPVPQPAGASGSHWGSEATPVRLSTWASCHIFPSGALSLRTGASHEGAQAWPSGARPCPREKRRVQQRRGPALGISRRARFSPEDSPPRLFCVIITLASPRRPFVQLDLFTRPPATRKEKLALKQSH